MVRVCMKETRKLNNGNLFSINLVTIATKGNVAMIRFMSNRCLTVVKCGYMKVMQGKYQYTQWDSFKIKLHWDSLKSSYNGIV